MNKKGFTLVELVTTCVLASVIILILINTVIVIKEIYNKSNTKTQLLIKQGNLSNTINTVLRKDNLKDYQVCDAGLLCGIFITKDGNTNTLEVTNDTIKFNDFVYKIDKGSKIDEENLKICRKSISTSAIYDTILVINIPITNKLYKNENFGIKAIYQYNSISSGLTVLKSCDL